MASKSIDWDELLLTNDPKKKQIEVSFKKIDGDGFLISKGEEPGTPGGGGESADGSQPVTDDEGDQPGATPGEPIGGGGNPLPPEFTPEQPNPCEPGIDCEASATLDVQSGSRAGVFGLYPANRANTQITTPLATNLFGTIHQIQQGDGGLSGWSTSSVGWAASNVGLKNYLLGENISICGEDVDIVTGFPQSAYVTSEFLSGGCQGVYPYNQDDEVDFTQSANFVVYMNPGTTLGQQTAISQISSVTVRGAYSPTTPNTTLSFGASSSLILRGNGAGQPHDILSNNALVGSYDFNVPGARIVTVSFATTMNANWKTDHEDFADDYLTTFGRGIIAMGGSGGGGIGGTTNEIDYEGNGTFPFYGTFTTEQASGLSRGVARYNTGGTILSGGTGGDDIKLAVARSVSTYETPSYCSRIPS